MRVIYVWMSQEEDCSQVVVSSVGTDEDDKGYRESSASPLGYRIPGEWQLQWALMTIRTHGDNPLQVIPREQRDGGQIFWVVTEPVAEAKPTECPKCACKPLRDPVNELFE